MSEQTLMREQLWKDIIDNLSLPSVYLAIIQPVPASPAGHYRLAQATAAHNTIRQ
jgi:hypothetical protein